MVNPVQSVVRAMAVLETFDAENTQLTVADVAERTGLARGTAHRLLTTLEGLGYIHGTNGVYQLTFRVLGIGGGYLASQALPSIAQQVCQRLSDRVDEHCSAGVLDGNSVLVVAASPVQRTIALQTRIGSRLPLATSATGRALFAERSKEVLTARTEALELTSGERSILVNEGQAAAERGYSLAEETLEVGVCAIGAPIHNSSGHIVAGLAVASMSARYADRSFVNAVKTPLLESVAEIEQGLATQIDLTKSP